MWSVVNDTERAVVRVAYSWCEGIGCQRLREPAEGPALLNQARTEGYSAGRASRIDFAVAVGS